MEFINLSRYVHVRNPVVPAFSELRTMRPLRLDQELTLVQDKDNLSYANELAGRGVVVARFVRVPRDLYMNRSTFPRRVCFEMTNDCNVLCRMCPRQEMKRKAQTLDKEVYMRIIDELDEHGIEYLSLFWIGEALTHPDFRELFEYVCHKQNIHDIWLSTNGKAFTETVCDLMLDSRLSFINYSMHAVSEDVYQTVIPKGDFNLARKNLDRFYEKKGFTKRPVKPFLHCQMIEQETTKDEVDAFINEHYQKADVLSVLMLEFGHLKNNSFAFEQREREVLKSCNRLKRNDCWIYSNGDVIPCAYDYEGELRVGNIFEQTVYEIWNSEPIRRLHELNNEERISEVEFCKHCTDYDL